MPDMKPDCAGDHWITLNAPSDVRVLPVIRRLIEAVCDLAAVPQRETHETVLAVHEACSNVIVHAHGSRAELLLSLACRLADGGLEIRLRDSGEPFDLSAVPEFDPAEARAGGRGVFLIRRLMDEVASSPAPEGGNELRMIKRLSR
jgi:anti-sigma regulatory factor (Ser/Thr protein kinase)